MVWIQQTHPAGSPKPTRVAFTLRMSEDGWEAVTAGLVRCVEKLCAEIPIWQSPNSWDGLLCQIWLISGKVVFVPCRYGYTGKEKVVVQLSSSFLQDLADNLPDPEVELGIQKEKALESFF